VALVLHQDDLERLGQVLRREGFERGALVGPVLRARLTVVRNEDHADSRRRHDRRLEVPGDRGQAVAAVETRAVSLVNKDAAGRLGGATPFNSKADGESKPRARRIQARSAIEKRAREQR